MSNLFPFGPYHAALTEPLLIDLTCEGELVKAVDVTRGYSNRGLASSLLGVSPHEAIRLVGYTCGASAHALSLGLSQAVEKISGTHVPDAACQARQAIASLERVSYNLLVAVRFAESLEAHRLARPTHLLRERVLDEIERLTGSRIRVSVNVIGGVSLGAEADPLRAARAITTLAADIFRVEIAFARSRRLRALAGSIGILSAAQASGLGITGPNARASGCMASSNSAPPAAEPARARDRSLAALRHGGDALARVLTRLHEASAEAGAASAALQNLATAGEHSFRSRHPAAELRPGVATSRVEGPEGEITCHVVADERCRLATVRFSTPAASNLAGLALAVTGAEIGDIPALIASFGICGACLDIADDS